MAAMTAQDLRSDETKAGDYRVHRAVAAERERCAKIIENSLVLVFGIVTKPDTLAALAAAIRQQ